MALVRYNQSNFTAGEIDPRLYTRFDYGGYTKGCKQLRNFVAIPQGGIQKRFGTQYVDTILGTTNPAYTDLWTLQYNDNTTYLILVQATTLTIYLENIQIYQVTGTPYQQEDIASLRFTQVENTLIVTNQDFQPRQLVRTHNAANVISGIDNLNNYINVTTALTVGQVLPIQFTTSGTLPVTSPQIYVGRTYFALVVTTNSIRIFSSSADAYADTNFYTISSVGTGTSNVVVHNTWNLNTITFVQEPAYDFGDTNYSSFTFTLDATTGTVTITSDANVFTPAMASPTSNASGGGLFTYGAGRLRLILYNSPTQMTGLVIEDFTNDVTSGVSGTLVFLGEPVWSNLRGWPRVCGFYQQRLVFGGAPLIANGIWMSITNEAFNFDDTEGLDTSAISYYTSSGVSNYIQAITSTESFIVHTNTGTYSTALGVLTPVTPSNFFLVEQNKDGCSSIPPVHIDNQVIYIDRSSNNVKNLQYDLIQSKYVLNNISIPSSGLIVDPVDMASYADPEFTDGSYVFVVNSDGTLAIFQTLVEQSIAGWSLSSTTQSATTGNFRHVATGINRAWFLVERVINGYTLLYIEELNFALYTDCSINLQNINSNVITGLSPLIGETTVQVTGDGFYLGEYTVDPLGDITLTQTVTNVTLGLPIYSTFEPLPLVMDLPNGSTYYKPKHIRTFYISYYQMYGAFMNGTLIPTVDMRNFVLGQPPMPINGVYQGTPMGEWDPLDPYADTLTITSNVPFPTTIIGIGYVVEM